VSVEEAPADSTGREPAPAALLHLGDALDEFDSGAFFEAIRGAVNTTSPLETFKMIGAGRRSL
jgi:hypothetical protein